jgi:WD40 repeat protein
MNWSWPRLRFGLRTLLVLVALCAVGAWLYTNRPERRRAWRNHQARQSIDSYELSVARGANPNGVPAELVAILGDSRLKHWNRLTQVALLPGEQLATGGHDDRIRIWNVRSGRQLHDLDGKSFTTSGNRQRLFLAGADGTIRCWDVAHAKVEKTLGTPVDVDRIALAANHDGKWLVAEMLQQNLMREILIWDVEAGRVSQRIKPDKPGGGALCITADGRYFTWQMDATIQVTDASNGKVLRQIGPIRSGDSKYMLGRVRLSADESKLFVGSATMSIVSFDWATGEEVERIGRGNSGVHTFAVDPGEHHFVFGGQSDLRTFRRGAEKVWTQWYGDRIRGRYIGTVDLYETTIAGASEDGVLLWSDIHNLSTLRLDGGSAPAIRRLAFHPDGNYMLSGDSEGFVALWDVGTWKQVRKWPAHSEGIETLAISGNGLRAITAAADNTVVVWNPFTGAEVSVLRGVYHPIGVGISPDGKQVIAGLQDRLFGDEFEVVDAVSGASLRKVGTIQHNIESAPAWNADGSRVAFLDGSGSLQVFDAENWKRIAKLGKTRFSQQRVVSVWLADNRRLVSTNWAGDQTHVLDVDNPKPLVTLNSGSGGAECVAVHPSEEWIAVCGRSMPVQIWHLPTAKLVKTWQLGPPGGVVSQVAFSPDGHYLATVNGNGTAYVLSLDGVLK